MTSSTVALMMLQLLAEKVAAAVREQYDGPYYWNGEEYSIFERKVTPTGYIDEYTNKENICSR